MKKCLERLTAMALGCAMSVSLFAGCGHEHEWSDWETEREADCVRAGEKIRTCDCGEEQSKTIPVQGHTKGEWIIDREATCTRTGKQHQVCGQCGETIETMDDVSATVYTPTEIHQMYEDSVGEVVTYDRSGNEYALGSCFAYSDDGKVITNYHVIEDAYSAEITFGSKTYDVEYVLAYDKDIDVAVLQISAKRLKPVTICEKTHKVGEAVYAFGNSRGLTSTFSDGMITYADREVDDVVYIQHDAPISSGNSGGPLINAYGEVIGINTWTMRDSQNLNFAICMSELDNLDYDEKLTMAEFYNKECNAYVRLREYIVANGKYNSSSGYYALELGMDYATDYNSKYTRSAFYYVEEDIISLDLDYSYVGEDDFSYLYIKIDESLSGIYQWNYFDDSYDTMGGTVYAASFGSGTTLTYTSSNIDYASLREACQGLSSSMLRLLLTTLKRDLQGLDITPADFGFTNY